MYRHHYLQYNTRISYQLDSIRYPKAKGIRVFFYSTSCNDQNSVAGLGRCNDCNNVIASVVPRWEVSSTDFL